MQRLAGVSVIAVVLLTCAPRVQPVNAEALAVSASDDFARAQRAISTCQTAERAFPPDVAKPCLLACVSEQMLPTLQAPMAAVAAELDAGLPTDAWGGRHRTRVTVNDAGVDLVVEQLPDAGLFCERAPAP